MTRFPSSKSSRALGRVPTCLSLSAKSRKADHMKRIAEFQSSRPRLPHSSDYADLVLQTAQEQNMTGYHLTVVYKSASTLEWANVSLKSFMGKFYHHVIS